MPAPVVEPRPAAPACASARPEEAQEASYLAASARMRSLAASFGSMQDVLYVLANGKGQRRRRSPHALMRPGGADKSARNQPAGESMIVAADLPAAVGNTPLIRLRRASEATGCEIWGKAEFMNPGQSVKDRAALWIIRDAVARGALRPGRHHRRGHRRQHRHRPGADRRGAGLSHGHRHPRHPEPGEEGHDPARRAPSSSRCRRCPTATRTTTCATPAGWPRSSPRPSRTARSGPTSSTTSPTARPMSRARRRRSGSRPTAGSTASSARSAPAARWPASPRGCAARDPGVRIGLADPDGAALYTTTPAAS